MSRLGIYVLCGTLCSLVVLGQGELTTQKPVVIPIDHNTTTPLPPTTTTPVPEPTKPPTPPTTTPQPTTTTPEPTTTTPKPTTTTPKPTTTTPKPTTTTTPVPPPTPAPTPKPTPPGPLPEPSVGNHTVTENNVTCIIIQFAAQLNVTYTKSVDNSTSTDHRCLNVPADATVVNSSCSEKNGTEQWFTLSWSEESFPAYMTLAFLKNGTNYNLQSLNVTLPAEIFPNASSKNPVELYHGAAWQTPVATSYRCNPATVLSLSSDPPATAGNLTLYKLQEEAFRTSAGTAFSAARDCGSGDVPDAVPIAVGCALGGLVIVVLVAYLVGRRRSASRGYLSM